MSWIQAVSTVETTWYTCTKEKMFYHSSQCQENKWLYSVKHIFLNLENIVDLKNDRDSINNNGIGNLEFSQLT